MSKKASVLIAVIIIVGLCCLCFGDDHPVVLEGKTITITFEPGDQVMVMIYKHFYSVSYTRKLADGKTLGQQRTGKTADVNKIVIIKGGGD